MKVIGFLGTVFAFVFFANLAYAKTVEIEMLNKDGSGRKMVYSEELVHVDRRYSSNGYQHLKDIT